ncbi:MAG: hypothetical protein ACRDKW_15615, partial [Actinomycetota bacterium]
AVAKLPAGTAALAVAPVARFMAGPRETVWNALVRRNYGCSHYIIAPRHERVAGLDGEDLYDPGACYTRLAAVQAELGIRAVALPKIIPVSGG